MKRAVAARVRSVGYALRGGATLLRTQPNARIHFVATLAVLVAGIACEISPGEWALVVVACALVWIAEGMNTALEFLADEVSLERRERIKRAKDVAAFSVLVAAAAAVCVGAVVFGPRVFPLIWK